MGFMRKTMTEFSFWMNYKCGNLTYATCLFTPQSFAKPCKIWLLVSTVSQVCATDRQPDMTAASALIVTNPLAEMLQATGGGLTWGPYILALSVDIRTVTHIFVWVRGY